MAAFETLVQRYTGALYQVSLRLLRNQPDAEDAVQQTFIQAFESLPRKRPEVPTRAWLFQVAHNKCIDLLRRRHAIPRSQLEREDDEATEADPMDAEPLPDEIYERAELQQLLRSAIDHLQPRAREVVLLRYLGDLTFAEIGSSLGIPENTAKTTFQRAKQQLRAFLRSRQ
jgi:RNA polymerase sigma-70 factor (ECF subfamily)